MLNQAGEIELHLAACIGIAQPFMIDPAVQRQVHFIILPGITQLVGRDSDGREGCGWFAM